MVIPMGGLSGPMNIRGPVPDECHQAVKRLKFTVLVMVGCVVGRIITATYMGFVGRDFFNLLNLIFVIVMGTFVLKDDEHFKSGYNFLATSICQQCHESGMGGLGCLMPFAMCCGLNFVLDLLFRLAQAFDPQMQPYGFFLAGSIFSQGIGAYVGYQMYKIVRDNGLGTGPDVEMGAGGLGGLQGGFLGGGARQYQPAQQGMDESAQQAQTPQSSFQPFGGSGQRLGG